MSFVGVMMVLVHMEFHGPADFVTMLYDFSMEFPIQIGATFAGM